MESIRVVFFVPQVVVLPSWARLYQLTRILHGSKELEHGLQAIVQYENIDFNHWHNPKKETDREYSTKPPFEGKVQTLRIIIFGTFCWENRSPLE